MVFFVIPAQLLAVTLDVAALPVGNVNDVINGDTLVGGGRANPDRVYRLGRGFVYQVTEPMRINGSINIVATDGTDRPPVLAPFIHLDNSSIDNFFDFVGKGAKVELNNLYLLSFRSDQNQLGWSDGIRLDADSIAFTLKGCIFDGFTHTAIQLNAHWNKINIQDCMFRNEMHSSAYFGGGAFLSGAPIHMDTTKFINNTFFCNNSYNWSIRGYCPYALLEHNTFVYGTVNPFLQRQGQNLHIKNNLFYAMHAYGGYPDDVINGTFLNFPDTSSSSLIFLRGTDSVSYYAQLWREVLGGPVGGPEVYADAAHGVTPAMVNISNRVIDVQNNSYFLPQKLVDFYNAYNDTVQITDTVLVPNGTAAQVPAVLKRILYPPKWISNYTQWTLDSLLSPASSNIVVANNQEADPGFNAEVSAHIDKLINYVRKIALHQADSTWFYNPGTPYPPVWPLPENLAYTNAALQNAGTDGYALGDLNWFPDQKELWLDVKSVTPEIPENYSISDAYPNPFNPETNVKFNLPQPASVKIIVYNLLGQKVKTLFNGELKAGTYNASWNGTDDLGGQVSSGIYFMSLESQQFNAIRKMILMK
jgi:hypothetical protein